MPGNKRRPAPSPIRRKRGNLAYKAGFAAEKLAIDHMLGQGFTLLGQRCKTPCGEIDILVADEDWLIAIEVKQRTTLTEARQALSSRQSHRLLQAFSFLIETRPDWQRSNTRLDVIAVDCGGAIEQIKDALRLY